MKPKHAKLAVLTLVSLVKFTVPSHAAEFFMDSFDYDNDPLVGAPNSLWETHSQASNGPVLIQSGRMELRSDQFEDINAPLAGGPYTVDGEVPTLYAQFMLESAELPTPAGTYFVHFRSGNAHRARVWISTINAAEGHYRIGIGNSSGANADSGEVPMDLQTNQSYRVVFRYQMATGLSSIGIDPSSESDLTAVATDPVGLSSVNSIAFRQSREIGSVWIDDIQVSDEFPGQKAERPRLEIILGTEGALVRWPSSAMDYVLESVPSVGSSNWTEEESSIESEGQWNTHEIPNVDGSRYFRLRQR